MELQKCRICGGFGKGLLIARKDICRHCARVRKIFFDPTTCTWCKEGYVDISPQADGAILKKTIKEGLPSTLIQDLCPAIVHYVGRLMDGSIFDTTREKVDGKLVGGTDDPFEFQLGVGKVILGWDIGIATMQKGEISRFIIKPEYAYAERGFPPKVEPHAILDFEIELTDYKDPMPRFPSKAELAESRKKADLEQQRRIEENPPPTIDERVRNALDFKERGNALVKEKKYDEAQKAYDSGFIYVFTPKEEWEVFPEDAKKSFISVKGSLHLNRALCKIMLEKYDDALWDCDQAIELDSSNVKGYFRRAKVYIEKIKIELKKEDDGEFWIIENAFKMVDEARKSIQKVKELSPDDGQNTTARIDSELRRAEIMLKRCDSMYKIEQQRLFKEKIFDRLESKNKKQKEENEDSDIYKDMPPLE